MCLEGCTSMIADVVAVLVGAEDKDDEVLGTSEAFF